MADVAVIAAVLIVVAAVRSRIATLPITAPMLFVGVGVVLGDGVLGALSIDVESETVALLAEFTLALLLFADASRIDVRRLRSSIHVPVRLLTIGLPLTIAMGTMVTALLLTDLSMIESALVAAVLAPTDAALGQAVITNPAVPIRVRQAIDVESGLNDGLVVPAVSLFLAISIGGEVDGPGRVATEAVGEIAIGVAVGAALAFVMSRIVGWAMTHEWTDAEGYRLVALGTAVLAFAGTTAIHGNGFLAAFVCGLLVRWFVGKEVAGHTELAEDAAQLGATATFVVFGAILVVPAFEGLTVPIALCAVVTLTLGRMIPVWLSLLGSGLEPATVAFIGWFGPRGLASTVFGLLVLQEESLTGRDQLFSVIVIVIVTSVVLHGITAAPFADRYGAWFDRHGHDEMQESQMVDCPPLRGERARSRRADS